MRGLLVLLSLSISTMVMGAEKTEVLNLTEGMQINDFKCVVRPGGGGELELRMNTTLENFGNPIVYSPEIELKHFRATVSGCDISALDTIFEESMMSFGFIIGVPIEVTKTTSESRRNGLGKCMALYRENLKIDLGEGVVLNSFAREVRSADGCQ